MKTIKEAVEQYINDLPVSHTCEYNAEENRQRRAFMSGVEFAQRWIPVEEELPENTKELMKGRHMSFDVIIKRQWDDNGEIKTEINNRFRSNDRTDFCWNYQFKGSIVTHWRPIERI